MIHRQAVRRLGTILAAAAAGMVALAMTLAPMSSADPQPPSADELIRPLPVIIPKSTGWQPKFPFPYSQTRNRVTAADLQAEDEMCQWFTAQYQTLNDQIGRLNFDRISQNGTDFDYSINGIQSQVDIVTANIAQSIDFLTPRVQALTQAQDFAGDNYFPLYQGDSFYGVWQQLSNVNNGIKAHQPDWFTGPSYLRLKRLAGEIHRSHVCD